MEDSRPGRLGLGLGLGVVRIESPIPEICGTDLHIFQAHPEVCVHSPAVLGHEMSGRISEVGPRVQGWSVGDPVTVMPVPPCGHCAICRSGRQRMQPLSSTDSAGCQVSMPSLVASPSTHEGEPSLLGAQPGDRRSHACRVVGHRRGSWPGRGRSSVRPCQPTCTEPCCGLTAGGSADERPRCGLLACCQRAPGQRAERRSASPLDPCGVIVAVPGFRYHPP